MRIPPNFSVRIAGNTFSDVTTLLVYDGTPLLRLRRNDEGYLSVDLDILSDTGAQRATVRNSSLVERNNEIDVSVAEFQFNVKDRSTGQMLCEISRRAAANAADLDISLLLRAPDGFLIHANSEQTNLRTRRSSKTGFGLP